ncbi:hypothetical protein GCM10028864_67860 [Microlunatus parietis]|nr:DUF1524 domain-containing protein [Microlunatus parietis]
MHNPTQPGWNPDPDRPGMERYFDGARWTNHIRQNVDTKAATKRKVNAVLLAAGAPIAALLVVAMVMTGISAATAPVAAEPAPVASEATPAEAPSAEPTRSSAPSASKAPAPTPTPTRAEPAAKPGTALALLQELIVKGRAPKTGYDRDEYGQRWKDIDRNGCGQRDDVLRRDLEVITTKANTDGCVVIAGALTDPYSGVVMSFEKGQAGMVEIDHVVSLSDAWQKGAQQWTETKREKFANSFLNLRAVTESSNASKNAGDAATWLPAINQCAYVAWQIAVKHEFELWVTKAERDAMSRVLTDCVDEKPPTPKVLTPPARDKTTDEPAPKPKKTESPKPKTSEEPQRKKSDEPKPEHTEKPKPKKTEEPREDDEDEEEDEEESGPQVVHPGSFCGSAGAEGVSKKGVPMECKTTDEDDRLRWRRAD